MRARVEKRSVLGWNKSLGIMAGDIGNSFCTALYAEKFGPAMVRSLFLDVLQ